MIRPIMKDPIFLAQKSAPATVLDLPVAQDLRDTLEAHRDGCVGMAANMIGVAKRNIIFDDHGIRIINQVIGAVVTLFSIISLFGTVTNLFRFF